MHLIYILWAMPRSTYTAFEWMMRMRGDMACYHEPFGVAWYQGDDARAPRLSDNGPRKPGLTFDGVIDELKRAARSRAVFSKDMPQYTDYLWTPDFVAQFQHSFLIRDPAKVLASLERSYRKAGAREASTRNEIGVDAQRRLFDLLWERDGAPPAVIDSDDFLEDPERMVEAYCRAIGVAFVPEALSWEPGDRGEVLWYDNDANIWHETLKNSDGLKPRPRNSAEIDELPSGAQDLYHAFLPHYQHLHLHQHRLRSPL